MNKVNDGLIFTSSECISCNKCIKGCPVLGANLASFDGDKNFIHVDGSRCIHCGKCLKNCKHNARYFKDDVETFFEDLKAGKKIVLMVAPSFFFDYEKEAEGILGYLKSLGVDKIYNVAFGANITTWAAIHYINDTKKTGLISSACPVIVDYIEKYKPELIDSLLPVMSPVGCLRTYLELKNNNPEVSYAFLGPCVGKKSEQIGNSKYSMDYCLTFNHLMEYLREKRVQTGNFFAKCDDIKAPGMGIFYPVPGGLRQNIVAFYGDSQYIKQVEGQDSAYRYLDFYEKQKKNNRTLPFFVDILNCNGGCIEGVATEKDVEYTEELSMKVHEGNYSDFLNTENTPFTDNSSPSERFMHIDKAFESLGITYSQFYRDFNKEASLIEVEVPSETLENIFRRMRKNTPEARNINCTSCGYKSCRDMALAIARGYNTPENCIHYMSDSLKADREALDGLVHQLYDSGENIITEHFDTESIVQALSKAISDVEEEKLNFSNESHAKSQFYAGMTHELRTPLNGILSMAQALKSGNLDKQSKENVDSIISAGNNLLDIVNELLDMSKLESGKFSIVNSDYELIPFVNDISNLIHFRASEKKLTYTMTVDPSTPSKLVGDSKRIRQILINLLGNAVKYTRLGLVALKVSWNNDIANPRMIFKITDSGIGIKEEDIPFLFDAYSQADEKKNHHIEGTGLGLSISKSLADEMNGSITVESVYGSGSTFTLELPQEIVEYEPVSTYIREKENTESKIQYVFPSASILVVDDMSVNRQVAENFLSKYKCNVVSVSSGEEAIQQVVQNYYDLVLMDYRMPIMNGLQTIKAIRSMDGNGKDVPIILMTAEDEMFFNEDSGNASFNGFLSKPIDAKALGIMLMEIIPMDKLKSLRGTLPDKGTFVRLMSAQDYEQYLLELCEVETFALKKAETQKCHVAASHRHAIYKGRLEYITQNADFLDTIVETLRD